ncbi:MAG: cytochrome c maturation protein CcmE [Gammaproteobacteria bacterium]|nr:cytochrome c maturation protein CcmE [Gammaproteobacteria bacterium]
MKPRQKRLMFVALGLIALGIATALVLNAFRGNMVFFYSPSDVIANEALMDRTFRLGGMVEEGSLVRESDGLTVRFMVTDTAQSIPVTYTGILPDLFREGQGVVTQGRMGDDGLFHADEVLAKHDETYMPPEVAEALERAKSQQAGPQGL